MADIDQLFAGMAAAQLNGRGNYMGEGLFLVVIKSIKVKQGFRGTSFICEFTIAESTNPSHPVGTTGSWVVKLDKPQAWGDIKALMFAINGTDPKTVAGPEQDPAGHAEATLLAKAVCGSEEALKQLGAVPGFLDGQPVKLETNKVKTQKGGDFTVHNWSPAPSAVAA